LFFTCFTSTKVQILTPEEQAVASLPRNADVLFLEWRDDSCAQSLYHTNYPLISMAYEPHRSAGTQFTGFSSTKVQILTRAPQAFSCLCKALASCIGTQFTCFTGTKVQILTPEEHTAQTAAADRLHH
jgi:hypothetical protein